MKLTILAGLFFWGKVLMMVVMLGFVVWFVFRGLSSAARKRISADTSSALVRQNKEKHE